MIILEIQTNARNPYLFPLHRDSRGPSLSLGPPKRLTQRSSCTPWATVPGKRSFAEQPLCKVGTTTLVAGVLATR